jgi:hypothetical protein
MQQLLPYLVKSVLVSGILTAYYLVALRNRRFHGYNRFYLLSVLVAGLLLPLIHIAWQPFAGVDRTPLVGFVRQAASAENMAARPRYFTVLYVLGLAVSLILLGLLSWRILHVYRLGHRQGVQRMEGYTLVETDDPRAPFSFFSTLFWRRGAILADPVNRKILNHELAHINGRHSWDSLFSQLVVCIFWMNPFFWLIRAELTMVHEFIADTATDMEGDAEGFARMLLQSIYAGRLLEPAHAFFQSPIKRRLMMINKNRSGGIALARKALVLPVLTVVILIVSCSKTQTPATLDAVDQAKLNKEKLDIKFKRFLLVGALKKPLRLQFLPDTGNVRLEFKNQLELVLQKAEGNKPLISR